MITLDQAQTAVALLAATFRSSMGDDTAELLMRRLQQPPFSDFETLMVVVATAIDSLDYLPTPHQLIIAYQAAARERAEADQRALQRSGRARTSTPQPDERYGREMVDVLRTALGDLNLGDGSRGHRHTPHVPAAATCTVCAGSEDEILRVQARVAELVVARKLMARPQPVPLYRCRHCQDRRVVEVDGPPGTMNVRPCGKCNGEQYEAWSDGQYASLRGW